MRGIPRPGHQARLPVDDCVPDRGQVGRDDSATAALRLDGNETQAFLVARRGNYRGHHGNCRRSKVVRHLLVDDAADKIHSITDPTNIRELDQPVAQRPVANHR